MTVTPIPGEPDRFFVSSSSRDLQHVVDMNYVEEPGRKPKSVCGCEAVMARGQKTCPHIEAVRRHIAKGDYTEKDFGVFK